MSVTAFIKRCLEAGMPLEMALVASEAFEAEAPESPTRTSRQERNRRYYERRRLKASETRLNKTDEDGLDAELVSSSPEPSPPSDPTPFTPLKGGVSPTPKPSLAKPNGFAAFWAAYPRKVGKRKAESAYAAAVGRAGADNPGATILAGLERAKRSRDWRREPEFIPHPTTWLNRDGWEDELDGSAPTKPQIVDFTPEQRTEHLRHYADTGEWREAWGPRPPPEVGRQPIPFPPDRTAA